MRRILFTFALVLSTAVPVIAQAAPCCSFSCARYEKPGCGYSRHMGFAYDIPAGQDYNWCLLKQSFICNSYKIEDILACHGNVSVAPNLLPGTRLFDIAEVISDPSVTIESEGNSISCTVNPQSVATYIGSEGETRYQYQSSCNMIPNFDGEDVTSLSVSDGVQTLVLPISEGPQE